MKSSSWTTLIEVAVVVGLLPLFVVMLLLGLFATVFFPIRPAK
jgi:hypothetical protein